MNDGETALGSLAGLVERFGLEPANLVSDLSALARGGAAPGARDLEALAPVRRAIGRLARVAPGRLGVELETLLSSDAAALALRWLEAAGALGALLPEVQALVGFHRSSPRPHKDLWEHTLSVVARVPPDPTLRWVALCHDIGKVATRAQADDGTLTFHRHEVHGAWLFRGIAARLALAPERAEAVAFVIEHHARTNQFDPSWTDRALTRLVRECGPYLPLMLAFSRADWTTRRRQRQVAIAEQQDELERRLLALMRPGVGLPEGLSERLMEATGREPGPWLGEARRWIEGELAKGAAAGDAAHWVDRYLSQARRAPGGSAPETPPQKV